MMELNAGGSTRSYGAEADEFGYIERLYSVVEQPRKIISTARCEGRSFVS